MKESAVICFISAAVTLLAGLLLTLGVFWFSGLRMMPSALADVYREEQNSLIVPGSMDLTLNRTGTYGIYYHYSLVTSTWDEAAVPPRISCSLTSRTGKSILGVADFVPSNRYWERENGGPAVLIQSITVEEPGTYRFSCIYPEGHSAPEIRVSLGPNYVWEMIRLLLKNGIALLVVLFSLPTTILFSAVLVLGGIVTEKGAGTAAF